MQICSYYDFSTMWKLILSVSETSNSDRESKPWGSYAWIKDNCFSLNEQSQSIILHSIDVILKQENHRSSQAHTKSFCLHIPESYKFFILMKLSNILGKWRSRGILIWSFFQITKIILDLYYCNRQLNSSFAAFIHVSNHTFLYSPLALLPHNLSGEGGWC